MTRAKNFNPGPATLPLAALARAQRELLDFEGTGMSILEHSHRGKAYSAVHEEALTLTRELLSIPDDYEVLLLQGGASQQFAVVPLNLLAPDRSADYVLTGVWSLKAIKEAGRVGKTRIAASTEQDGRFTRVPTSSEIEIDPAASYLHLTSNNTIYGTQFFDFPDTGRVPLVADMSSDLMWRPIDVSKFGLIYAGAQKNLGPSGLTLVIVRKDLIEAGRRDIPVIFQYRTHAETQSLYNTIPTFAVYLYRNVLAVTKELGGLGAMERHNRTKAELLYQAIDAHPEVYRCPVEPRSRSVMNVVFTLPSPDAEARFLKAAQDRQMVGIKGHRSVGGIRVSLYNAVELEWVRALTELMDEFAKQQ